MHPEIARRAILAGTSEKGVCPECGAPWRRVVEPIYTPTDKARGRNKYTGGRDEHPTGDWVGGYPDLRRSNNTTGWQPTCKCGRTNTVPATVLDPFDDGMYRGDEQVKDYRILQGDVRDVLGTLPDESVHVVCTSPPYWNLRDYGTADWQGGSEECDHKPSIRPRSERANPSGSGIGQGGRYSDAQDEGTAAFRDICGKCGARRVDRQLGLEPTPGEFVQHMVEIFREVRRVLRRDGTLWLNMGDSYAGSGKAHGDDKTLNKGSLAARGINPYNVPQGLKPKDLVGMPWRVAFALQEDGWYLRSAITWCKRAPMPESVTDRPTSATEMIFLLARSEKYYYDADAVREPHKPESIQRMKSPLGAMRDRFDQSDPKAGNFNNYLERETGWGNPSGANMRNFWLLGPEPYAAAHFAVFPSAIPDRCIRAGTSERGVCPACGAPWKRVVERAPAEHPASYNGSTFTNGKTAVPHANVGQGPRYERTGATAWQPTCKCGRTDTVPALVLDPFFGAGTTGLVALRLNRRAIGIELNPEYIAMSHKRIQGDPRAMNLNMELVEMEESA